MKHRDYKLPEVIRHYGTKMRRGQTVMYFIGWLNILTGRITKTKPRRQK
jgi:hypothetical protein